MDYQTFKISPQFLLEVRDSPRGFELSDYDKTRVEMVWRQATEASRLFNGQILNFVSLEENKLVGEFVDYKFFYAQLKDPGLEPLLKIAPVCISSVTLSGEKILFGRRSKEVTQFKGHYECVPSGGIDAGLLKNGTLDLQQQFARELWEETGISVTEIKRIDPFQIVHDPATRHYEVCAQIDVNYMVVHDPLEATEEYSEFAWIPKSELKGFLKKHEGEFVPFSLYLLSSKRFH